MIIAIFWVRGNPGIDAMNGEHKKYYFLSSSRPGKTLTCFIHYAQMLLIPSFNFQVTLFLIKQTIHIMLVFLVYNANWNTCAALISDLVKVFARLCLKLLLSFLPKKLIWSYLLQKVWSLNYFNKACLFIRSQVSIWRINVYKYLLEISNRNTVSYHQNYF